MINLGLDVNCNYLLHYKNISQTYTNPNVCFDTLCSSFLQTWTNKIVNIVDLDLKLKVYHSINIDLKEPVYDNNINEHNRIILTRYRTGSHNLRIERGRWTSPITPREQRLCKCLTDVQNLTHCISDCPILISIRSLIDSSNLNLAFKSQNIIKFF